MGKETETNPEISASAEELDDAKVSTVSHSFRLEWKIPMKALTDRSYVPRPMPESLRLDEGDKVIVNSKLFEFENLKFHRFSLVLINKPIGIYEIKLVTYPAGPKLEYAFVCIEDRICYLAFPEKSPPAFLNDSEFMRRRVSTRVLTQLKNITVMCGISAISSTNLSPPEEVNSDSEDGDRLVWKSSIFPGLPPHTLKSWSTKTSSTGSEAFVKYLYCGELPTLDVGLAKDLLVVSSRKENAELKALCVEYLVKNLSAENVAGVMKVACDSHVKYLVDKCNQFISNYCYIVDKRNKS